MKKQTSAYQVIKKQELADTKDALDMRTAERDSAEREVKALELKVQDYQHQVNIMGKVIEDYQWLLTLTGERNKKK